MLYQYELHVQELKHIHVYRACNCVETYREACILTEKMNVTVVIPPLEVKCNKYYLYNWKVHIIFTHTLKERKSIFFFWFMAQPPFHTFPLTHPATLLWQKTNADSFWLGLSLFHLTTTLFLNTQLQWNKVWVICKLFNQVQIHMIFRWVIFVCIWQFMLCTPIQNSECKIQPDPELLWESKHKPNKLMLMMFFLRSH